MKKIFNNKGSTLVLLVMAIAVISLLGTSILGVTMMNLKIKKTNTALKQTFYLSESGLDQSYAKAYELVQEAVKLANEEAKSFIDEFKPENIEFLSNNYPHNDPYSSCLIPIKETDDDGIEHIVGYSFDEEKIKLEAEKKFKTYYKEYLVTPNYKGKGNDDIVTKLDGTYDNLTVDITYDTPLAFNGDELLLAIDSKYTKNNIQKTTAVNLVIDVPKYDEPYKVLTKVIPVNPFWTKALTAKNLTVNGNSEFNGNIYLSEKLFVDGASVNPVFNGKLAVKGDMELNGDNSTTNVKDVYAHNILLHGDRAEFLASCSAGTMDSGAGIYVKDDLEIDKSNQQVNINGSYYGFSEGSQDKNPDHSSGININTTDTSNISVVIKDDVYLYGTSYVSVSKNNEKYQTGESVSIKGNYRAYTEPLLKPSITPDNIDLTDYNINFEDYEYLRFADSVKNPSGNLKIFDKAFYMYFYNEEYGGLLNLSPNIKLAETGEIQSLGNTIKNGNIITPTYYLEKRVIDKFIKAGTIYDDEILRLGDKTLSSGDLQFGDEVKLSDLSTNIIENTTSGAETEIVYINKDGGTYNLTTGNYTGLIVTNGNLNITGNVTFKGSIICGGDITIDGVGSKRFTYDKSIVSRIIAEHEDLYKKVFKPDTSGMEPIIITYFVPDSVAGNNSVNVDFNKLLKFNEWKTK